MLAAEMRYSYNQAQREELFEAWGVKPNSKGRKMQLVKKLWEPAYTQDQAGIEACALVVRHLAGPDATEQFVQLMFGNTAEGEPLALGAWCLLDPLCARCGRVYRYTIHPKGLLYLRMPYFNWSYRWLDED